MALTIQGLDLPQLYTQPSADELLEILELLEIKPRSWNTDSASQGSKDSKALPVNSEDVSRYLTSIIASSLVWIEDEVARERVWEEASARLSERSGRTAMKSFDRTFDIPTRDGKLQLLIHEPALTADNLGLKTWAASYLLAKRFYSLSLPSASSANFSVALELGSGTGLVGMAAAAILGITVCLTDLPSIIGNLQRNVDRNLEAIQNRGGKVIVTVLDWSDPCSLQVPTDIAVTHDVSCKEEMNMTFPLILAADTVYSMEHPRILVKVIKHWLTKSTDARVIFELPRRPGYERELQFLVKELETEGLVMTEQGEEVGYDDWGSSEVDDDQPGAVHCWYSVWGWKLSSL